MIDLSKIKIKNIYLYISLLTATPLSGIAIFYIFKNDFFLSVDIVKLLLISFACTTPILILNTLLLSNVFIQLKTELGILEEEQAPIILLLSSLFTNFILYIGLLIKLNREITFEQYKSITIWIQFIFFILYIVSWFLVKREIKKRNKKDD